MPNMVGLPVTGWSAEAQNGFGTTGKVGETKWGRVIAQSPPREDNRVDVTMELREGIPLHEVQFGLDATVIRNAHCVERIVRVRSIGAFDIGSPTWLGDS